MLKKLLQAGSWVFIGVFLGRIAGFLREVSVAGNLGATPDADVAVLILTVPDILLNILLGGAMGAALIPEFKLLDRFRARNLYHQALLSFGSLFILVSAILSYKIDWLLKLLAPGLNPNALVNTRYLLSLSLLSIPLSVLSAVTRAYLESNHKFSTSAMGTLIYNLSILLCIHFCPCSNLLVRLSIGVLLGATLRWVIQLFSFSKLIQKGFSAKDTKTWELNCKILLRYIQVLIAGGLLFVIPVIARSSASLNGPGSMAVFNYTFKIMELPTGAFLSIFAVVLLPTFSDINSGPENSGDLPKLLRFSLLAQVALSIPIAIGIAWFSPTIIKIIFGWEVLPPCQVLKIARLTSLGMLSVPAVGLYSVTTAVLNSKRDAQSLFWISLFATICFFPLCRILLKCYHLDGIIIAYVVTNWLILIGHCCIIKFHHAIQVFDIAFFHDVFVITITSLMLFSPFAIASIHLHARTSVLSLAFAGGLISVAGSLISIRPLRQRLPAKVKLFLPPSVRPYFEAVK